MSRKVYWLLFLIIVLQGVAMVYMFTREGKNKETIKDEPPRVLWQTWKKMGDDAFKKKDYRRAGYYYEKTLRDLPQDMSAEARAEIEKNLLAVYEKMEKKKKTKAPATGGPDLFQAAQAAYDERDYRRARMLFYRFLARQDRDKAHKKLVSRVYLRISQCDFFLHQARQNPKIEDAAVADALELIGQ